LRGGRTEPAGLRESEPVSEQRVRRRVVVQGRVQGVFFRDSVRERARAHDVDGWACNRSDGAVEVVLEGERDQVARVVRFCETGPSRADVGNVEVSEEQPEGLSGFEIR
jgi:acylphosphatase